MIQFFRKIRKGLLAENKFLRYLTYAAGEILLVIIGILAALQINNWNEEQKNKHKVEGVLSQIQEDIRANIIATTTACNYYFFKDSLIQSIMNDKIDFFDFDNPDIDVARSPILTVSPVTLINNGFNNWAEQEQIPDDYKVLNDAFNKLFIDWKAGMDYSEEKVTALVDDNVKYLADNHSWLHDRWSNNMNQITRRKEAIYYQNDVFYKNKLMVYNIYAIANYLPLIDAYRTLSIDTYKEIDKLLRPGKSTTTDDFFLPSQTYLERFVGTYEDPNNPELRPTIKVGENHLIYNLGDFEAKMTPLSANSFFTGQVGNPAKITFKMRGDSVYSMSESQYGEYTELRKLD